MMCVEAEEGLVTQHFPIVASDVALVVVVAHLILKIKKLGMILSCLFPFSGFHFVRITWV